MTMFRVGPAGIPASLKTDMNAILNKKFGTSGQNYPPKQWPEEVNLLGALEEKTASGSIVTFSDGADDVPLKSCEVALPAYLNGYSSVDVVNNGKNFLDDTLANLEQGSINGSTGANENANNRVRSINAIPFPYDKIASSYTWTIPSGYKVAIRPYDKNGNFVQFPSWALAFITQLPTDLIGHGITQMKFVLAKIDNTAITPSDIANVGFQIEVGSTASTYEPYTAPTTYTASLGRTIYGGQADIVNGTGTDENGNDFTFTGQEVPTRLGYNAFWSDEGDTEVTYRGQGTLTPVLPTLISKTITENGTYNASDDSADGYSSVTVNVSGGSCERLLYLHCVNNDQIEIPAASSITQGAKYSQYVSYDSTTKKFTVLQDFTAIIIAWVYTYQTYESSRSDGAIYINNSQVAQYEASGTAAGSTGGVYLARNFKQNDTFNVYTPTRNGYPQQNLKIYLLADVPDNIYTFTDENE